VDAVKLYCDICAGPRPYEQPPCRDHDHCDCPEWACVSCGDALVIGLFPVRSERRAGVDARRRLRAA